MANVQITYTPNGLQISSATVQQGDTVTFHLPATGLFVGSNPEGLFESASTQWVADGQQLTVAYNAVGSYEVKVGAMVNPWVSGGLEVRSATPKKVTVHYNGTGLLRCTPTSFVNHGDTVELRGIPPGASNAKLHWHDPRLFVGYTRSQNTAPVANGSQFTVSNEATLSSEVLVLEFTLNGVKLDSKTSSGTLDPTGNEVGAA